MSDVSILSIDKIKIFWVGMQVERVNRINKNGEEENSSGFRCV